MVKPAKQKEQIRLQKAQHYEDIKSVMSTAAGRRFFWRLLDEANIFRSCFTGNSQTFYLEGRREFMLPFYEDLMTACPESFFQAQRENFKQEENNGNQCNTESGSPE